MRRNITPLVVAALVVAAHAHGLNGSAASTTILFDTTGPTLVSAMAVADNAVSVVFSKPMLTSSALIGEAFMLSGPGSGTLGATPMAVSEEGSAAHYLLEWDSGEMRDGVMATLTVNNVRDGLGNLIAPLGNSVSFTGRGTAPTFTGLTVEPSIAFPGDRTRLSFVVSEPLVELPNVMINGHAAELMAGGTATEYVYGYTITEEDTPGMAAIQIWGVDLAGNAGALSVTDALEIKAPPPELPLAWWVWLVIAALTVALAAMTFPASKRVRTVLLTLCMAANAHASAPLVSNVVVVQRPDANGGTVVDIHYDLVAPNGPCDITVSLSKNDGNDGYPFPVTTVTGAVHHVSTGVDNHILWDIAADYPDEVMAQARLLVTAEDGFGQYTLVYTAGAGGAISGATSQTVDHGTSGAPVTAMAHTGYHFVNWSDGITTATRVDEQVMSHINVTANFAINQYTLTYTIASGGSIDGAATQTVSHGANGAPVVAVPDTGYHFVNWSDGVATPSRTDSAITTNLTVTAHFAINQYVLTYAPGANGTLDGSTAQTVEHGANGDPVFAVANVGHHFVQWSDGVVANPRTDIQVSAPLSVTAYFAINQYTLAYAPGPNGAVEGVLMQTVPHGGDGTPLLAVAHAGHHFTRWSDNVTANPRKDENVTVPISVLALFAINQYTLSYTAGSGGSLAGTVSQTVNHGANGTTLFALPDPGYYFVEWSDGVTANPRTDQDVTGDIAVTAIFAIYQYTLAYGASAGGSIVGISPQIVNHGAAGAPVTAVPDTGHHFVVWSDGVTEATRTDQNVTAHLTVTANFAINQYALTYTADAGGSINGVSSQTVNHGSDGTSVTAVPDTGHHFLGWSDGVTAATRTDQNVTAHLSVTAHFAINQYTLTYRAGAGGSIEGESSQTVNHGSDGAPVTAIPDAGHHFVDWEDGIMVPSRIDENVTDAIDVTANFAINQYTLTYTAGAGGSIDGASPQIVNHGEDGAPVTAVPDMGHHFVQWSDGVSAPQRAASNVTDDIALTAVFAPGEMVVLQTGAFDMGRSYTDTGNSNELPVHTVTLDAYEIGRHPVTNRQFADVLNWALAQGRLTDSGGNPYTGGVIYAHGVVVADIQASYLFAQLVFSEGVFDFRSRTGHNDVTYSMADHPVIRVSWFGAVLYCNWLSEMHGLQPCYNPADWTRFTPLRNGYRLPTEAEWERAAAWDGAAHRRFGVSDSAITITRANFNDISNSYSNPLGLTTQPFTAPVGWYNGINPARLSAPGVLTTNSVTPAGLYDTAGSVWDWCHDRYGQDYYTSSPPENPTGPTTGNTRILRGGGWSDIAGDCRAARRSSFEPGNRHYGVGFRLARTR